jgi:hypothetical protein
MARRDRSERILSLPHCTVCLCILCFFLVDIIYGNRHLFGGIIGAQFVFADSRSCYSAAIISMAGSRDRMMGVGDAEFVFAVL